MIIELKKKCGSAALRPGGAVVDEAQRVRPRDVAVDGRVGVGPERGEDSPDDRDEPEHGERDQEHVQAARGAGGASSAAPDLLGLRGRCGRRRGHARFSANAFATKIEIGTSEIMSRITAIAEP